MPAVPDALCFIAVNKQRYHKFFVSIGLHNRITLHILTHTVKQYIRIKLILSLRILGPKGTSILTLQLGSRSRWAPASEVWVPPSIVGTAVSSTSITMRWPCHYLIIDSSLLAGSTWRMRSWASRAIICSTATRPIAIVTNSLDLIAKIRRLRIVIHILTILLMAKYKGIYIRRQG